MADDDAPQVLARPDPLVRRFNDVVTTVMDALGVLLLAAAAGAGAWEAWGIPVGLLCAGLVVTALSGIAQRRQIPARPAKVPRGKHPHVTALPGPEDPGTLHVRGH